jgi:anti-sigma regulatory factor (Ser/Thr protein kinase)
MEDEVRVAITTDADLVTARAEGRAMAERLGFPRPDPTLIATAISEVARNIVVHVGRGEIVLKPFEDANRYGVVVIATDEGPASVTSRPPSATTTAEGAASASACRGHGDSWTTSRSPRAPTAARR